jgi:hypothetical protein
VNELKVRTKNLLLTSMWKNEDWAAPPISPDHRSSAEGKRLDSADVKIEVVGVDMISLLTGTPP